MATDAPIAFIGLGNMGGPIANRMQEQGAILRVVDSRQGASSQFVANGAIAVETPLQTDTEIVFLCLPSEKNVRDVLYGATGLLESPSTRVIVNLSTIGRTSTVEFAASAQAAGKVFIDAPVSGGPPSARAGTMTVMLSGDAEECERLEPLLKRFAARIFRVGTEPGQAQSLKLVNNLLAAANLATAMEAFVLGAKAGLDPQMMLDVINVSSGRNSGTLDKIGRCVLDRSFNWGMNTEIIIKDLKLAMDEANDLGVPMWLGSQVVAMWRFGVTQGDANRDWTSLIQHMEGWAKTEVKSHAVPTS